MDDKYLAAISKGDEAIKRKDWDTARSAYNEASTINPTEQYPKNQLNAIILMEKEQQGGIEFDTVPPPVNLGKAESFKQQDTPDSITGSNIGWKPVPVENLPSSGLFYPTGTTLEIKAAAVAEIRHFSTIDENDPLDMDDKLNVIIDKCVRLRFPDRNASWKDLKEEDRFYIIFAVRDLTFINGENKLFVSVKCGRTCKGDGTYSERVELKKDNFEYYKIDEKLMRFYNENERCFVVDSPKVGVIKMYVPSLGITSFIKNMLRDKLQKNEFYDKAFLKTAPFMFPDWRGLDEKQYNAKVQESVGWSPLKHAAIMRIAEMIRFGVKTELKRECNKCGAEVVAPLTFPGGVKSIFITSDPLGELFGE